VPEEIEHNILRLEITENLLNHPQFSRDWWEPLRMRWAVPNLPVKGNVVCTADESRVTWEFPPRA
jgi:hypothetical protein